VALQSGNSACTNQKATVLARCAGASRTAYRQCGHFGSLIDQDGASILLNQLRDSGDCLLMKVVPASAGRPRINVQRLFQIAVVHGTVSPPAPASMSVERQIRTRRHGADHFFPR